jgi:hypothetical protein
MRIFYGIVAVMAAGGGLAIGLAPDEWLFPWLFGILILLASVPGELLFAWVRTRVVALDAGGVEPQPVLLLEEERIPRTVWLGVLAPLATLGLILWLGTHWSAVEPRIAGERIGTWRDPAFRTVLQFLFTDLGWCVWFLIYALGVWHGMARRYPFRKSQFSGAIATTWSATLLTPAIVLPTLLRLSALGLIACVLAGGLGVWLFVTYALRARREVRAAGLPPSSQAFYYDRNDPAAFGDRGMNVGSPWNWALFAAPAVFFVAPLVLLLW